MPITVLLADDTSFILKAIKRTLEEDPRIQVVGEAATFAATIEMLQRHKPDVLLLDLSMPAHQDFAADFVKSHLASSATQTIAISFAIDQESQLLAESYGLSLLLDKMKLDDELVPAILETAYQNPAAARTSANGFPKSATNSGPTIDIGVEP
jgi:chemotaxis response regulator CheB